MSIFQGFLLEHNNKKEPEFHIGQKANSKREKGQEMPISCRGQKVDAKKEEHLTSRTQKNQKVTSTTCVNAENKLKYLYLYIGILPKDKIREQNE